MSPQSFEFTPSAIPRLGIANVPLPVHLRKGRDLAEAGDQGMSRRQGCLLLLSVLGPQLGAAPRAVTAQGLFQPKLSLDGMLPAVC